MLLCAVILTAVEDYRIAKRRGFITKGKIMMQGRIKIRTMDQISELRSLTSFFFEGGLESLIDAASLQDDEGNQLDASAITNAL
tara:strand:+ start:278 stop:529 length:252 start_codon:yes stop_codon:yes gene_type:complete